MFPDLPEHLQALNALPGNTPPSSTAMNQEQEEAFWGFLHADELFRNFGNAPSPSEQQHFSDDKFKEQQLYQQQSQSQQILAPAPAPTPVAQTPITSPADSKQDIKNNQTLESFIAAYIGQSSTNGASSSTQNHLNNYIMPMSTSFNGLAPAPSTAPTPVGLPPSEILPGSVLFSDESPDESRVSGAKRLKQLGAGQVEIEEDKRRRNTEASARFRAKKKERESKLETRAKELEGQLAALQAENTSLENENRLLKAIVLNGASGSVPTMPGSMASSGANPAPSLQAALAALGQKRKREE